VVQWYHWKWPCFREHSSGDIVVLANCSALSVFVAAGYEGIAGKFPGIFLGGPVTLTNFPRKLPLRTFRDSSSGDIFVFQHTPEATNISVGSTKYTGEEQLLCALLSCCGSS